MSDFFSTRLKLLRGDRNKAEFSRFLGIPAPMYHRYELGQVPKQENLRVISDRCGVTIDWLLGAGHLEKTAEVREPPAAYPAPADRPADHADTSRLDEVVARLDKMQTQIDTVIRLLGHRLK
jgi:transcriptional regulator with XRE-family HTH domain